jgi:hypothetical protein
MQLDTVFHELGHNLGLQVRGHAASTCDAVHCCVEVQSSCLRGSASGWPGTGNSHVPTIAQVLCLSEAVA